MKSARDTRSTGTAAEFELRAVRADWLPRRNPAAAAPLAFAAGLQRAQGRIATLLEALLGSNALSGVVERDATHLLAGAGELLQFAAEHGPPAVASDARDRLQ